MAGVPGRTSARQATCISAASPIATLHGLWIIMSPLSEIRIGSPAMAITEAELAAIPSTTTSTARPFDARWSRRASARSF